jgi:poly-beta-1,6-N-acetyl-D-glucosamine synthase
MTWLFWGAIGFITYTYLGYPVWLSIRRWLRPQLVRSSPCWPSISIILVVHNEAGTLRQKLRNLLEIDYPEANTQIIVVSDGSTDDTNRILSEFASASQIRVILKQQNEGKAAALNHALEVAAGEIVVFTDARQRIEADAIARLMENFTDPSVGCVSGQLYLRDPGTGESNGTLGMYWRIEKLVRKMEAASGSVVGATGALYAVRRNLLLPIPPGTILDDVFIPMEVVRQKARVILDARARVWDEADLGTGREFSRKVRTLTGVYQLLRLQPWLLSSANPMRFEFISHKLLRLAVPFALCAALISSFFLTGMIYRIGLVLQLGFYALSIYRVFSRHDRVFKIADVAFTFVLLNTAALVAFVNFLVGRKPAWGGSNERLTISSSAPAAD